MKILIVDDSKQIRRHVARTLQSSGHTSCEAEDGLVALDMLEKEEDIDVVLMDRYMPVMDGIESLQAIKQEPNYDHIKVVMMTTENKAELIQEAIDCGADEYIMKPLTKEVIEEKLEALDDDFL
jgi:two-component system, chemotaxis family, chemotaxis protein CheY